MLNRFINAAPDPENGLIMNICDVAGVASAVSAGIRGRQRCSPSAGVVVKNAQRVWVNLHAFTQVLNQADRLRAPHSGLCIA